MPEGEPDDGERLRLWRTPIAMSYPDWLTLRVTGLMPDGAEWLEQRVSYLTDGHAPAGWGRLAARYAEDADIDARVVAAIALKETGRFNYGGTDPVFSADPTFHNFGGIKTTDGKATHRFPSDSLGVRGLVAHVVWYAHPFHADPICGRAGRNLLGHEIDINATEFDPRHFTWGHKAQLRTVADFGHGVWNMGDTYATSIAKLVEEIWLG